ncbi:MAG: STAS domain-containing protein [Acidimicrobiales bacterium]
MPLRRTQPGSATSSINRATCRSCSISRGLEFIDSSGLAVLVKAQQHIRSKGGDIVLSHVSRAVHRVLEITGLDASFEIREQIDGNSVGHLTERQEGHHA